MHASTIAATSSPNRLRIRSNVAAPPDPRPRRAAGRLSPRPAPAVLEDDRAHPAGGRRRARSCLFGSGFGAAASLRPAPARSALAQIRHEKPATGYTRTPRPPARPVLGSVQIQSDSPLAEVVPEAAAADQSSPLSSLAATSIQTLAVFASCGRTATRPSYGTPCGRSARVTHHHTGGTAADLDGEVRAAIPRVYLAHRSKEQPGHRRRDRRHMARVAHEWDRLGVGRAVQPGPSPTRAGTPVDPRERRQDRSTSSSRELEVLVVGFG